MSSSVIGSQIVVMSGQWRVSVHMFIPQNGMQHSEEWDFILFDQTPVPNIDIPKRHSFLDSSLSEMLVRKAHCPQNKTFIREVRSQGSEAVIRT